VKLELGSSFKKPTS